MYRGILLCAVAFLAFGFAVAGTTRAEEGKKGQTTQAQQDSATSSSGTKAILADATRVSTEKAMKGATQQRTKKELPEEAASSEPGSSAVSELRPASPDQAAPAKEAGGPEAKKESKGGPLKNIHGTVHGGTGTGSRNAGAAVGASTRSGKAAIYVETQQNRETSPQR